jgi:hypothetical protein
VNLDESYVCNPDLGCGLVAGYGLSGGASDRPGFGWFFGGDAAINSFAMTGAGLAPLVREGVFRFFAQYQRADGKITHEISQGAKRVDWFSYPYPFYHGDTTPFWILAFGEYWRQTADTALVRELWMNLKRAYDWSRKTDVNGDGLMENPAAGAGALEVGDLQIGILSDVYLGGVWVASLERFAAIARALGSDALADSALQIRSRAMETLEAKLWNPALGQYAFALLQDGSVNPNLTAWPATAMSFALFDSTRGAQMATRLASSDIMTDWGARPLSATSALFDPLHYNNGAVWPFVTGFVSLAQYRYHNAPAGFFALQAIARTGFDQSLGRNPEVISGRLYKPLDTAVPHQFFATSMVLTPLLRGLLGVDVDVPRGRVTLAPHLPPGWDSVNVDNVPVGRSTISFTLRRTAGAMTAIMRRRGPDRSPLELVFSPALPLGARVAGSGMTTVTNPGDVHATIHASVTDSSFVEVRFTGGWAILPPVMPAAIGSRSRAPRVLSERLGGSGSAGGRYVVTLEGLSGLRYTFGIRAPDEVIATALDATTSAGASVQLGPKMPGTLRTVEVIFPSTGANADGYARTTLTLTGAPKP